jgi:Zn-dependent M28 family amino/carboxypeptidase
VTIELKQNNTVLHSGNIVADIKGIKDKEKMLFTAHYDSTMFSKGAWDNASGCANLMSLYSYFIKNKPDRSIRFIWCGGEELGLKGSRAYVERHMQELDDFSLGINIDMTGTVIGNDIACVTGDDSIKSYLQYCASEAAFPVSVSSGIFPSDSSSFAYAGVPFIVFQRGGQGGMHTRNDRIDFLSERSLRNTTEFIRFVSQRLLNSKRFPVPRTIPERIREELENYFR